MTHINNLISMTNVMIQGSRSTGNPLSNTATTRQRHVNESKTTRQRALGTSEEKRENITARCINAASLRRVAMILCVLMLSIGQMWAYDYNINSGARVYLDDSESNWEGQNYSKIYWVINDADVLELTKIDNTRLYWYYRSVATYENSWQYRILATSAPWGSAGGYDNMHTNGLNISNVYQYYNMNSQNYYWLKLSKTGDKDHQADLTVGWLGNTTSWGLNKTITLKAKVMAVNANSYSETNTPGALSATSYSFTADGVCDHAEAGSLSAGSSSATFTAGYTATTTLTAASKENYQFTGWYDADGNLLSTDATCTVYPTTDATYFAYYAAMPTATLTLPNNGGSMPIGKTNYTPYYLYNAISADQDTLLMSPYTIIEQVSSAPLWITKGNKDTGSNGISASGFFKGNASGTYKSGGQAKYYKLGTYRLLVRVTNCTEVRIYGSSASKDSQLKLSVYEISSGSAAVEPAFTPVVGAKNTYAVLTQSSLSPSKEYLIEITGTADKDNVVNEVALFSPASSSCTTPTASWATAPANGNVGGNMDATLTTNYATGVVYTSNNTDVATVSGDGTTTCTITYKAAGSARITATVTGDGATICAGPATCYTDITVSKKTPTNFTVSGTTAICPGGNTDITLSGSQSDISYQLYKGASKEGAAKTGTGSSLTWNVSAAGTYTVKAVENTTYAAATMSGNAVITVNTATAIGTQPSSVAHANVGSSASLSGLAATGTSLTYQWQTCNSDGTGAADINTGTNPSAATATLSITPAAAGVTYYKCVVTGTCGNATSNVVSITAKNTISPTLTYNAYSVEVDGTLTATLDKKGSDGSVTYTSSNDAVATVASDGTVTGVSAGTVTITATIADGTSHWGNTATSSTITVSAPTYTVTYNYNGATGGNGTASATAASVTLPTPTKTGYSFDGWYTTAGAKVDDGGETYSPTADITLYARWTETCSGGGGGGGSTTLFAWTKGTATDNISISGSGSESLTTSNRGTMSTGTSIYVKNSSASNKSLEHNAKGYKLGSNEVYIEIQGTSNFAAGDVVSVQGYDNATGANYFAISKSTLTHVGNATESDTVRTTAIDSDSEEIYDATLKTSIAGEKIHIFRMPGSSMYVKKITVTRSGSGSSSKCNKVLYHGNGATSGYIYDPAVYDDDDDPTVLGNVAANGVPFVRSGYTFLGWDEDEDVTTPTYTAASIAAGTASITNIDADVDLYAIWEEEEDETTYYLVTSTAQLNTTDTYVIMDDGKNAMMGVATGDNEYLNAVTSGFTAASDKSTVTVTSTDVNTLTLQAESSAWNIVGKNNKKLSTKGTVDGKLYANTDKATASETDDFVFSFADGKATIKRNKTTDFHIYYTSGTGFNQSETATNIRLYTSNSTPVDVTAPTLSSSTPEDDATGVGVSGNIELTFSENVTINDASKFTLTGGAGTLNTASASASGAVVTIPYSGLAYNTTYTLATAAEAVKDGSNNKNAALSDITFTTLSATGSCNELNYVWAYGSTKTPKGNSVSYNESDTATIINSNVATTHITISGTNYAQKKGGKGNGSLNLAKAKDNYFLLTAASGYVIDSVYFYGKLEDGQCRMSTDGSTWTGTLGNGSTTTETVYAIGVNSQCFGLKNKNIDSPAGVWIRTMMVKVCPEGTTYTVTYNANGHGSAPDAETEIAPGSNISAPSAPTADCWTFGGWYKERACTNVWNFAEDEVNSNITLYAKWTSNAARVKSMNYGETNYTVTEGTADALTVTPVSTTGVTYKWLTNTTDDASSASVVEGAEAASYSPSIAAEGTKYYWAVLVHACGNDTTSGIRIHVTAAKTEPTIVWGNVQLNGEDTDPTYGGGGYTLTGTINGGNASTPTLTTDMISADGGNKSVTDAGKTFSLTFDVTAAFDTTQAKLTNIHFSLPSNATYNDSVFSTNLSYEKCSGGSYSTDVYVVGYTNATGTSVSSSPANKALKVAKSWISTASPSFTDKTSTDGFEISATQSGKYWKQSNQTIITTTTGATMRMYRLGTKSLTITWTSSSLSFSKIRVFGMNTSSDPSTLTVSNGTTSTTVTFAGNETGTKEVTMAFTYGSSNGVRFTTTNAKEVDALIELVPTGSDGAGTGTATELQWKSGKAPSDISGWDGTANKLVKAQSDDNFTCVAEQTSATNSVGAITYVSSDVTVATVNATTGEVDIVAGAAGGEATITATMARSGCFKAATLSYTISVSELVCDIDPGTLSASATSKCEDAEVTLTLSDYTSTGTTISWYKSGTAEPLTDGSTYDIDGATLTTAQEGTYYAKVTLTSSGCSLTSNNVTITNKSGAASVSKLVNQWYIKKGRTTPDVALWQLGEGSSYVANSAKADGEVLDDQLGGCTVIARDDGIIYLSGADPTGIAAAGNVSLTVQVQDECGHTTTSDAITIRKQIATDKHELAFVTIGTNYSKKEFTEDAWTDGIKAANSTSLALYQLLKDTFKIQATNIYASDDEQKIREYYSQYDLICITDYPNTKTPGKNGKSYVDAIGSLIDIRPVLTMEAWVSGLDNWRNKGVVGTRTTPSKRQYNMFLQCKDHEIFEGVRVEQIGYGDDALFKVNMVDSTESRYVELDAVSKGNYASDTAALQGFTTGEMDLLAIGLIDNGSGTNLQVGAERQEVMKARMMVLGINSYAMERLSDDGLRVVLNALQYLTKKRAEDISDCSSYFIGGADGHEDEWGWAANWRSGMIPTSNQEARILQPVVVSDTRKIASVKIVAYGTFQDEEAGGSLTIAPTGALIVEDKIQRSIAPNVMSGSPTQSGDIIIETDPDDGQGALMLNNDDERTQATVNLYSKGCNNGSYQFQYFASPFNSISSWAFDAYIYNHSETLNTEWTQLRYGEDVEAFQGLALTADGAAKNYEIAGTLASTQPHVYELSYTSSKANNKKGTNVVGNSWSAPIQITRIDDSDFDNPSNFEGVIYIYNAGRDVLVDGKVYASNGNSEPGQWQSIPVALAKDESWEHKRQIPAFQAFQMKVNDATEFTLNYNKHVRQEASVGDNNYNEPLHAPRRSMRSEAVKVLRLCVEDEQVGKSYIYLCEGNQFTEERDRGWEAQQTIGSGKYGKLYAIDQARDYMMSIARESLEGTPVGFISGLSTEYTITFNETEGTYYLNDMETQQSTLIQEGESYTFTTTKGNHPNRFIISAIPFDKPGIATGVTDLDAEAPKVQKVIYNDKLYIIRGGKVYSAEGQIVK